MKTRSSRVKDFMLTWKSVLGGGSARSSGAWRVRRVRQAARRAGRRWASGRGRGAPGHTFLRLRDALLLPAARTRGSAREQQRFSRAVAARRVVSAPWETPEALTTGRRGLRAAFGRRGRRALTNRSRTTRRCVRFARPRGPARRVPARLTQRCNTALVLATTAGSPGRPAALQRRLLRWLPGRGAVGLPALCAGACRRLAAPLRAATVPRAGATRPRTPLTRARPPRAAAAAGARARADAAHQHHPQQRQPQEADAQSRPRP